MEISKRFLAFVLIAISVLTLSFVLQTGSATTTEFDSGWVQVYVQSAICIDGCDSPCFSWFGDNCGCSAQSDFGLPWIQKASSCQGNGYKLLCQGGTCNILGDAGVGKTLDVPGTGEYFVSVEAEYNDGTPERMFVGVNTFGANSERRLSADLSDSPNGEVVECVFRDPFFVSSDPAQVWFEGDTGSGSVKLSNYRVSTCIPEDVGIYCESGLPVDADDPNVCGFVPPACSFTDDPLCGTDGFIEPAYCSGNDLVQDYFDFSCNNPGESTAFCSNTTTTFTLETCAYGCTSGTCNPEPPICTTDEECGTDGPVGAPYCSGSDRVQDEIEFTCSSGTCSNQTITNTLETCAYGCTSGTCNPEPPVGDQINLTIIHPEEGQVINYTTNIPLDFIVEGPADSCWYSLNDGANITLPSCQNTTFSIGEGNHKITLFANNSLNEIFQDMVSFTVNLTGTPPGTDTDGPVVTLTSPSNNADRDPDQEFSLAFSAEDPSGVVECTFWNDFEGNFEAHDTLTFTGSTTVLGNAQFEISDEDTYIWNVECKDTLGNKAFAPSNFTLVIEEDDDNDDDNDEYDFPDTPRSSYIPTFGKNITIWENDPITLTSSSEEKKSSWIYWWIFLLILAILILIVLILLIKSSE